MSKKSFKNKLDNLFKENLSEINATNQSTQNTDISDQEEFQWMIIKIQRYEKELKLWRTGVLDKDKFEESLKKSGLFYDKKINQILKKQ